LNISSVSFNSLFVKIGIIYFLITIISANFLWYIHIIVSFFHFFYFTDNLIIIFSFCLFQCFMYVVLPLLQIVLCKYPIDKFLRISFPSVFFS
jgi:hypothetical protein